MVMLMKVNIKRNKNVKGKIKISGSKNSALPIICASILNKNKVVLKNIPRIQDVFEMLEILKFINCKISFKRNVLKINSSRIIYKPLLLEMCQKMRASYYFIGAFLTLFNKCEILLPGGCNIGKRPINYHINALTEMGFMCEINDNILIVKKAKNKEIFNVKICEKSVGTTMNILLASLGFKQGCIKNALIEPECEDLISFLKTMGFSIILNKDEIFINNKLLIRKSLKYKIIPDRIETMTYTVLGLLCGDLVINQCNPNHLLSPLSILLDAGYNIQILKNCLHVKKSVGNQIDIITDVYPGFPTDLQPIFGVLITQTKNGGIVKENIFENRLQIYRDLIDLGINCSIDKNEVLINPGRLSFFNLKAQDLRHGAALIIMGAINGEAMIDNFEYVLRGYEKIIQKMNRIGIKISKVKKCSENVI